MRNFYATPRLPKALQHPFVAEIRKFVSDPKNGGYSKPVIEKTIKFRGIVMPLSNKDWLQLPEGSYTKDSQKLYTDDKIDLPEGQLVTDSRTGQQYTIKTLLDHGDIHPLLRYIVDGVKR